MTHRRRQIRDAALAAVAAIPSVSGRVTNSPIFPLSLKQGDLPSLAVWTTDEEVDGSGSMAPPYRQGRMVTLVMEGRAIGDSAIDALDQIALECEQSVMTDPTFGALAAFCELATTELSTSDELEEPLLMLTLEFKCMYTVDGVDPQ